MRYDEITSGPYFLGSKKPLSGTLHGGSVDAGLCVPEIEALLEACKPGNFLARPQTLLLHDRPNGRYNYLYKVRALDDDVRRYHTGWLALLAETDPNQPGVMAFNAESFWKGLECKEHRDRHWEFRASSVSIIEKVGWSLAQSKLT